MMLMINQANKICAHFSNHDTWPNFVLNLAVYGQQIHPDWNSFWVCIAITNQVPKLGYGLFLVGKPVIFNGRAALKKGQ